ncbi:MAG: nucleoside phosphorylase [Bacteroidota bacterium]|nr:nucleoside phosphorylase [Bacteroidota bacterium]
MRTVKSTELIITKDGKIYHLNISREDIANDIIIVGDPDRVRQISSFFDSIETQISHREFITHTGQYNNRRLSVISTGIGTDNIDIVMNELDAVVNIDFESRMPTKEHTELNIIRIGTSGAIQQNINVNTFIASSYALGFDNLAHFYQHENIIEKEISRAFIKYSNWPKELSDPYIVKSSKKLLKKFQHLEHGITVTAPGFYAPQGRTLRAENSISELNEKLNAFSFKGKKITNFEMETSALYFLSKCLGHHALTICAIIGNRITQQYSSNHKKAINELIDNVLKKITE